MTLLKAELQHARARRDGFSPSQRLFSSVDLLGRLGCTLPGLANFALGSRLVRGVLNRVLGLSSERPLPAYARQRFDRWFAGRPSRPAGPRGRVILWDDTFVRYHEPHIGKAAVKVLEAAGFQVALPVGRKCCGRPAFSQGNLDEVMRLGRHNLKILASQMGAAPVLFLEPSCYSMFAEDYRELKLEGAEKISRSCFLFEQFVEDLLSHDPGALQFRPKAGNVVIHAHCHTKSLLNPAFLPKLARRLPQREVKLLETGCCGMAGAYGMMESRHDVSLRVAEPLLRQLQSKPFGTTVVASGTSCRHQIEHLSAHRPRHMAEVLAEALTTPTT
jgi:Fe-S oxidoreductase